MIHLKTNKEIKIMKDAGFKLRKVMSELLPTIRVGMTTNQIDKKAEELIIKNGGEPGFKKVPNYRWSTCLSINEQAVHTPPSDRELQDGDVLTVDIGLNEQGFHTDHATTFIVGEKKDAKIERFLDVGKKTLDKAIAYVKSGHYVGEISKTIQDEIRGNGYFILRELTGHGVGRQLHEDPLIPGFLDRPVEKTYKMRPGLVIAIEVIYSMGTEKIKYEDGVDWSIVTADNSMSACFEHTVALTSRSAITLT